MVPPMAAWSLWVKGHGTPAGEFVWTWYTSYGGAMRQSMTWDNAPLTVSTNVFRLLQSAGALCLALPEIPGQTAIALTLVGIAAIWGAVRLAADTGITPIHLFGVFYSLLLVVWITPPNERLALPLETLLVAGLVYQARAAGERRRWLLLAAPLLAVRGFFGAHQYLEQFEAEVASDRTAYEWIGAHVPREAKFLSAYDTALFLYTGRQAIGYQIPEMLQYRRDSAAVKQALQAIPDFAARHGIGYVYANERFNATDFEATESHRILTGSGAFERVFQSGGASVYRFIGGH